MASKREQNAEYYVEKRNVILICVSVMENKIRDADS